MSEWLCVCVVGVLGVCVVVCMCGRCFGCMCGCMYVW